MQVFFSFFKLGLVELSILKKYIRTICGTKIQKQERSEVFEEVMHLYKSFTINENFDICQTQNFHFHFCLINGNEKLQGYT